MSYSDDAVESLRQVLQIMRERGLEASRIQCGHITLDLLPRSQVDADDTRDERKPLPLDASGGRMRS